MNYYKPNSVHVPTEYVLKARKILWENFKGDSHNEKDYEYIPNSYCNGVPGVNIRFTNSMLEMRFNMLYTESLGN